MMVFSPIPALVTLGLALAQFLVASASPQTNRKTKPVTLTGTVTDSSCGAKHMMTGDDVNCVRACVKNGSQYALVVNQEVYPLNGRSEELNGQAGQRVMVTGALDTTGLEVASLKSADTVLATQSQSSNDAEIPPATATIEGLVRDIACPIQNKNTTATVFNRKCAEECAKLGSPLILLTNDGVLYTPISASMPDQDQRQR